MLCLPFPCVYFTLIQPRNDSQKGLSWDLTVVIRQMREGETEEGKMDRRGGGNREHEEGDLICRNPSRQSDYSYRTWWPSSMMVKQKNQDRNSKCICTFLSTQVTVILSCFGSTPRSVFSSLCCPIKDTASGADLTNPSTIERSGINY